MSSFSSVQAEEALLQVRIPAMGHREAHECAVALGEGDISACYQSYSRAESWEDRWFCLEHIAAVVSAESAKAYPSSDEASSDAALIDAAMIDAWAEGWPDHPVPLLIRSALGAFDGRGISADLAKVEDKEPNNPLIHGLRVVAGASRDGSNLEASLGAMLAITPLYEPHVHLLRSLGPNNGGDVAAMLEFAHSVDEVVPAGSPLRALLPLAAIEVILAEAPDDHLACLDGYGLRSSIMMAAGQSVFHPAFVGRPSIPGVKAMTAFMVALELLGEDDLAVMLHRRLDGVFADWPFSLLAPPTMASWNELGRIMDQNGPKAAVAGKRA